MATNPAMTSTIKKLARKQNLIKGTFRINWFTVVIVGWMVLLGSSMFERVRPASDWFQVYSMYAENTYLGDDPVMHYSRDIKQRFLGRFVTQLEKNFGKTGWSAVCTSTGTVNYAPDKSPPDPLMLSWWTRPVICTPSALGTYRVSTTWVIDLPGNLTKQVFYTSPPFEVLPRPPGMAPAKVTSTP